MVFLMKIYQQPSNEFCDVKYSKAKKEEGAIIRGGTSEEIRYFIDTT